MCDNLFVLPLGKIGSSLGFIVGIVSSRQLLEFDWLCRFKVEKIVKIKKNSTRSIVKKLPKIVIIMTQLLE